MATTTSPLTLNDLMPELRLVKQYLRGEIDGDKLAFECSIRGIGPQRMLGAILVMQDAMTDPTDAHRGGHDGGGGTDGTA